MVDLEQRIQTYVADEMMGPQGRETNELSANTELFRSGIIDSFGLLGLVQFLEAAFSIRVQDDEMHPENFRDVSSIARFVRSKKA